MSASERYRDGRTQVRSLLRYFHTLRHLRPTQVLARAWFRLHRPRPDTRTAPALRPVSRAYLPPIERATSLLAPALFRFLNEERGCSLGADWHPAGMDKLWIYNLHYFDDLNAHEAGARRHWHLELLQRWVVENPPGQGMGWEPYPLSRRIVNWVKWDLRTRELPSECRMSLAVQARWLLGRLEYHLLGNHLLTNANALVHAGLYFSGTEAQRWYSRGRHVLERELGEQVLPDGGHFERSPMYHAAALEDLLDLVNLLRTYGQTPPAAWFPVIAAMRRWLKVMTHPDGEIGFFNDAAFGVAATSAELEAYADRLDLERIADPQEPLMVLLPSGYVRALAGPAYLLCDCAPVGPNQQPGHAHADTLSFELSLAGTRVFVNSGTSRYGIGSERQRQRGTAAHNTVVVDGADSSEVWAGFRVARRARASLHAARATPQGLLIEGCHDGYRRLRGRNEHWRQWRLEAGSLSVEDRLSGEFNVAEARFHLHPEVTARTSGPCGAVLACAEGYRAQMVFEGAASVHVAPSTWHPRFGVEVANQCVIARFAGTTLRTHVRWAKVP